MARWTLRVVASFAGCLALSVLVSSQTLAAPRAADNTVDVLLVLAVDISYSMDPDEQALQREGY
ncbi:MAG: hypothetical protein B7Y70_09445, partial [Rhizobiales bacterium 35-68-8]